MKKVIEKIAELANYLDSKGYAEEAGALDNVLVSLAQRKALTIGNNVYYDAPSAWQAYNSKEYNKYMYALSQALNMSPGELRTANDIKDALVIYFRDGQAKQEQIPTSQNTESDQADEKGGTRELKWWKPTDWDDYAKKYMNDLRPTDAPGFGRMNIK